MYGLIKSNVPDLMHMVNKKNLVVPSKFNLLKAAFVGGSFFCQAGQRDSGLAASGDGTN